MARLLGLICLALCLSLAPSALVRAQTADESMDVEAHALFEAGRTAFAAGRFADALAHFQSAYDLSHRGALLYNIGQCHDRLRHDQQALTAFRGYLEAVPAAPQRAEVESRIVILEEALSHAAPVAETSSTTTTTTPTETATTTTTTPTESTTTEPHPSTEPPRGPPPASNDVGPGPWIVLGVGAALVVVGAILVGLAFDAIGQVQNAPVNADWSTVHAAYDNAPIFSGAGWAAIGIGAAMAVGGIVWGVVGASSSGDGSHAELHLTPSGLSLTGAF